MRGTRGGWGHRGGAGDAPVGVANCSRTLLQPRVTMKDCLPTRLHSVSRHTEHLNTQTSSSGGGRGDGGVNVTGAPPEEEITVALAPGIGLKTLFLVLGRRLHTGRDGDNVGGHGDGGVNVTRAPHRRNNHRLRHGNWLKNWIWGVGGGRLKKNRHEPHVPQFPPSRPFKPPRHTLISCGN